MNVKTRLQEFERALEAAKHEDIGDTIFDALEKVCMDMDGADFAVALLCMDNAALAPFMLTWREKLIEAILEYLKLGQAKPFYISTKVNGGDDL